MTAEVRQGDWREVLPGTYDPQFAVVITDPPFGIGKGHWDIAPGSLRDEIADVLEYLPAMRYVIRCSVGNLAQGNLPAPARICAEVATYRMGALQVGTVQYGWHPWLVYGRRRIRAQSTGRTRDWVQVYQSRAPGPTPTPGGRLPHSGLTPWEAADWAVATWADDRGVVLDPYAGLGTIGLRAIARGFDYLAAERDPAFARAAAEGIDAMAGQATLAL